MPQAHTHTACLPVCDGSGQVRKKEWLQCWKRLFSDSAAAFDPPMTAKETENLWYLKVRSAVLASFKDMDEQGGSGQLSLFELDAWLCGTTYAADTPRHTTARFAALTSAFARRRAYDPPEDALPPSRAATMQGGRAQQWDAIGSWALAQRRMRTRLDRDLEKARALRMVDAPAPSPSGAHVLPRGFADGTYAMSPMMG